MALMDAPSLHRQELLDSILISLFFGAMLVMLLYNASLWLFTRDRSYGYYALYLLMSLCYTLALTGFGPLYLGLDGPWLAIRMYTVGGTLCFVLAGLYLHHFLELQRQGGWLKWLNHASIGYWSLTSLLLLLAPYSALLHLLNPQLMSLVSIVFGLATGLYLWAKGNPSAKLFTLAWALLILSSLACMLALAGHLPLNDLTLNSQLLGMAVEFTLLSIALAERINRERAQRIQAQQDTLAYAERLAREREEKLHAQQQALRIQRQTNEELEQRVRQRTQDLEQAKLRLESAITELARLSQTDPLTELCNRRHFDECIRQELCRAKRSQTPLALLMIDIDHFKALNDNHGHPFGDECLRAVAVLLRQFSQRAGDLAARFGGEEFILLLPGTHRTAAGLLAENLRQAIAALALQHDGQTVRLSASIGLIAEVPHLDAGVDELIKLADAALYRAKRAGRNRVVDAAEEPVDSPA
ncbi:diguanylate cyclase [Pseudomonas cavernae]